jgi:hypothetical protein
VIAVKWDMLCGGKTGGNLGVAIHKAAKSSHKSSRRTVQVVHHVANGHQKRWPLQQYLMQSKLRIFGQRKQKIHGAK